MKQLIVNADDFGASPGVNRGILYAHQNGIVTSTTVMINLPDAAAGLEQALADAPDLGIGLHLNVTAGEPVSPPELVASLLDEDGQFIHIDGWAARFAQINPDQLRREIHAQFERFASLAGRPPDHLDAHHHATYLHPAGLQTMIALAHAHGDLPMRGIPVSDSDEQMVATLRGVFPTFDDALAHSLVEQLGSVLSAGPLPFWPARLEMGFFGPHATLGDLLNILTGLADPSLTEIMCHPGYSEDLPARSQYRDRRPQELGHLTHAATLECVKAEIIQLVTFGDLPRPA